MVRVGISKIVVETTTEGFLGKGYHKNRGFPSGTVGKEVSCQCRRHEFDPWVGKILWSRKWQRTPVFLPGEFHGQRSLEGCNPWGQKKSDTLEQLSMDACTK